MSRWVMVPVLAMLCAGPIQAESKDAQESLVVTNATYIKHENRNKDQIELTVENNTSHSVAYFRFVGTLYSPDREVHWSRKSHRQFIPGGLEPGEERVIRAEAPSDAKHAELPDDLHYQVKVLALHDARGRHLE